MNRRITVHVSQEDQEQGVAGNCEACPVARAINRRLKPDCFVDVAESDLLIQRVADDREWPIRTPQVVKDFIQRYDKAALDGVKRTEGDFWFPLELPEEVLA